MSNRVTVTVTNGIAQVLFNRADKMNALDREQLYAIADAAEQVKQDSSVRAVVMSGDGRAFCAGLDVANFASALSGDSEGAAENIAPLIERTHGLANLYQAVAWAWREVPVPVIAALHGVAYGGGFQIALGADMRYATADTRMSVMEMKWGLVPDMAGTQLMRHLAREDIVRELTYSARVFTAVEAQEYGFVTRVCDDPLAEALSTAEAIAGRNPDAIRGAKRLLNEAPYLPAAEGLMLESEIQDGIIGKPNQLEAVMSELEKRPGNFTDPS